MHQRSCTWLQPHFFLTVIWSPPSPPSPQAGPRLCTGSWPQPTLCTGPYPPGDGRTTLTPWTSLLLPPPGYVPICPLCSPYCRQTGSWHSTEMPSCLIKFYFRMPCRSKMRSFSLILYKIQLCQLNVFFRHLEPVRKIHIVSNRVFFSVV